MRNIHQLQESELSPVINALMEYRGKEKAQSRLEQIITGCHAQTCEVKQLAQTLLAQAKTRAAKLELTAEMRTAFDRLNQRDLITSLDNFGQKFNLNDFAVGSLYAKWQVL